MSVTENSVDITGQLYIIHNSVTQTSYVGQTLSHRKNKEKYKPFGYEGRFRDHISEAVCNTKKKQCRYLNNAIRKYGKDVFSVELLYTCPKEDIDMWERHFIDKHNTLYPNGYNLTRGGKTTARVSADDVEQVAPTNLPRQRGGCDSRTEETREKISLGIKKSLESSDVRESLAKRTRVQHNKKKIERFAGVSIDVDDIDKYIRCKMNCGRSVVIVQVDDRKASFTGLYMTEDKLREQARGFLLEIANSATPSNCSGNP
jgi:hypothetical protein